MIIKQTCFPLPSTLSMSSGIGSLAVCNPTLLEEMIGQNFDFYKYKCNQTRRHSCISKIFALFNFSELDLNIKKQQMNFQSSVLIDLLCGNDNHAK